MNAAQLPPPYVGRFAPSPTGPLHAGSLVAALASYLDARANGGQWLLRIEDVDTTRCRDAHVEPILNCLRAHGLDWDGEVMVQSRRTQRYEAALASLAAAGWLFGCACTRREIADNAMAGVDGPVYPGTCRERGLPLEANAVRMKASPSGPGTNATSSPLRFVDQVQGEVVQHLARDVGDFVLKRRDALFTYQLAVVVDDADSGVTHVVRGADLIDSTARQIHLYAALGLALPAYLHIPVMANAAGEKLSKQTLATPLNVTTAIDNLSRALAFLGQNPIPAGLSIREWLQHAASNWQPGRIPRVRSIPHSG